MAVVLHLTLHANLTVHLMGGMTFVATLNYPLLTFRAHLALLDSFLPGQKSLEFCQCKPIVLLEGFSSPHRGTENNFSQPR
ncbi:MAG: hypothetical protein ACU843_02985, partial [Gammaproteobacteria bacterium]